MILDILRGLRPSFFMIRIIDNYLTKSYANFLEDKLASREQVWFYRDDSTFTNSTNNKIIDGTHPTFSFSFALCDFQNGMIDSPYTNYVLPFIHQLFDDFNTSTLLRSRLDMTVYNPDGCRHTPHTDLRVPNLTCIYYVNDSDGDTVIYNERQTSNDLPETKEYTIAKSVTPRKNRLLVFDGDMIHTGHSPKKHMNRILINTNISTLSSSCLNK